jgi:hypothetical protein
MSRPVFLVGSIPFADAEEVFTRCAAELGALAPQLPDGERGGWLPSASFAKTRGLTIGHGRSLLDPPIKQTFRLAAGFRASGVEFESLHYLPNALQSWRIFDRLKQEGRIPAATRFQVSVPSAFTACIYFDRDQVRELWPAYEAALLREVRRIVAAIPEDQLAISWDVVEFGIILANPEPLEPFGFDELAAALARAIDAVAPSVPSGLHFCYGGHNSNGMPREGLNRREINDTGLMASFFNAIHARVHRPINWLHIPVPRPHSEPRYFEALKNLECDPQMKLFLGLLYPDDGLERTSAKLQAARACGMPFGVAAACGLNPFVSGLPAERLPETLHYHRLAANLD